MKYGVNDRPGPGPMLLYGLQWWAVSLPAIVIMGLVAGRLHHSELGELTLYLQKMYGLIGLAMAGQALFGHRLPLVVGPAAILLVGLTASMATEASAVYTAVAVGGGVLAVAGATGLLTRLRFFFTSRLVGVVLVLIALTLGPTILKLILATGQRPAGHLVFAAVTVLTLIMINQRLPGVWKSLTVLLGLAGGTGAYFLLLGSPGPLEPIPAARSSLFIERFDFQAGPVVAFLFCFLALAINELGSIESIGRMLAAGEPERRVKRGMVAQGLANLVSGAMGVIGPVSYSLSAGVIAGTGCASRYTLIPAGLGLFCCAFFPGVILVFTHIPEAVMGALMLYLMAGQLASGLTLLLAEKGVADFAGGLIVGLPVLTGLLVSFAPPAVWSDFPALIRPLAANGFIVGLVAAVILEHVIFRPKRG